MTFDDLRQSLVSQPESLSQFTVPRFQLGNSSFHRLEFFLPFQPRFRTRQVVLLPLQLFLGSALASRRLLKFIDALQSQSN